MEIFYTSVRYTRLSACVTASLWRLANVAGTTTNWGLKTRKEKRKLGSFEGRLHIVLVWDQGLSCHGMCRNGCISSTAALEMFWKQKVFFGVEEKPWKVHNSLCHPNVGGLAASSLFLGLNDQSCNQLPQTDTLRPWGRFPFIPYQFLQHCQHMMGFCSTGRGQNPVLRVMGTLGWDEAVKSLINTK